MPKETGHQFLSGREAEFRALERKDGSCEHASEGDGPVVERAVGGSHLEAREARSCAQH